MLWGNHRDHREHGEEFIFWRGHRGFWRAVSPENPYSPFLMETSIPENLLQRNFFDFQAIGFEAFQRQARTVSHQK